MADEEQVPLRLEDLEAKKLRCLSCGGPLWQADRAGPLLLVVDDGWAAARDWDARKKLAEDFQKRFYEQVPYIPLGMFFQKAAWRNNIDGVLDNTKVVWWNATKK